YRPGAAGGRCLMAAAPDGSAVGVAEWSPASPLRGTLHLYRRRGQREWSQLLPGQPVALRVAQTAGRIVVGLQRHPRGAQPARMAGSCGCRRLTPRRTEGWIVAVTFLSVGYDNFVVSDRIVAIVGCTSAPIRRLIQESRQSGKLLDATQGRRMRSVLLMDNG